MHFDELKRKKLIDVYRKLPEEERAAYRALAVTYIPTGITRLVPILSASLKAAGLPQTWAPAQYAGMLERWQRLQLAEKCQELGAHGWACVRLMTEVAAREAVERGEFSAFEDSAERVLKLSSEEEYNVYETVTRYFRAARSALYRGNAERYGRLAGAKIYPGKCRYLNNGDGGASVFVEILGNPVDLRLLASLPPGLASGAFHFFLKKSLGDAPLFQETFDAFENFFRKHGQEKPEVIPDWGDFAFLAGRGDEVLAALEKTELPHKYAFAALDALLKGGRAQALELYEAGLRLLRKAEGRRKVAYASWTGVLYPLLLLHSGAPVKKIEDCLDGVRALEGRLLSPASYNMLPFLLPVKPQNQDFFQLAPSLSGRPERCVDAFFFLLYAYWLDMDRARALRPLADETFRHLTRLGLKFLAAELGAIIHELWEPPLWNDEDPAHPLKTLLAGQNEWERSLNALSGIGSMGNGKGNGSAAAKGSRRFVWEIRWSPQDKNLRRIQLTPIEQTLQANGWSKGKGVALRRLYLKADTVAGMTDQDYRAASAIREERSYYGVNYFIDVPQALEALAGHPCVFNEEDGSRVEIVTDEPRLTVEEKDGGYHLTLSPFPEGDAVPRHIVQEDGPNCLRVTRFEERHIRMSEILREKGLTVPAEARDALLKALGSLASVVTIHSDLEGVEADAAQIDADPRLYVQLQPSEEGLDVEIVARPLGPNSVPCRPGAGGASLFGLVDGKRVQARRSLDKEKDAFISTVKACPALADAEQVADERWHVPSPETALEFLTQVQALGGAIVAEWPRGQTMRVRPQVSASSMSVSVRGVQDWFAFSGELRIDENLVLNMKDLLELLKAAHGRFLPLGDGQFLALTKEFRRRLEILSVLGETKGNEVRVSPLAVGILAPLEDEAGSFKGGPEWERRKARIAESAELSPALPSTFRGELRNYQLEGYQWLTRLAHWGAGACLADDMGLGKTIQALALLVARGSAGPALVVAPTSVGPNWIAEAGRFAPTLDMKELRSGDREKILANPGPLDVVVTTYGLLQNEIERLSAIRWHTIVLDEAQAIKNMGTKRSVAAMKLAGDFRMVTTGTPIENRLGELWNLFRFLNPSFLGSLESFNRRFATPVERDGDKAARSRLKKIIQPFILRRNKEQVLEELPSKTEITLRVEMKEEEWAFYESLRRSSVEKLSGSDAADQRFRIFAELMRLRRACCNAALVMPEVGAEQGAGKKFPSAKLEAFSEILTDLRENAHKALVFSQFVDHLTILREYLDGEGVAYQYLDGSTPPRERKRRVAAFQSGEGECFLISLKAGGTGLNLTAADYVIHMDPWWNPAVEEQASDRAHRIGQSRPVTVYRIVAKGTVEEKIVDLHAWKRDLAESLLDEAEAPLRLSAEEMLALIQEAGQTGRDINI